RTSAASKILESYRPPYDATAWELLRDQRMVLLGKTNLDEFAMGSSTENSAYGTSRNPWDTTRVPGGSSGGSAAAVAAGMAPLALGTDTGGSIRQPASLCGIVGMKPTYGLVSRYGLIAFASSLDQVGPMTRSVRDSALLLSVLSQHDPRDSTSIPGDRPDYLAGLGRPIEGLRFGVVTELMGAGTQPGVLARTREAIDALQRLGGIIEEVSLPSFEYALDAYYLIAPAEASSNLARYDGTRYGLREPAADIFRMNRATRERGFGPEVKRRIILGTYALSSGYYDAWYGRAQKVRTQIVRDFERAYEKADLLVSPTSPTTAFRIGERAADPMQMYMSDICTIPTNLAGACAISIPCGLSADDGLPVGFHLMGPPLAEPTLFRAAYALEQELAFDVSGGWSRQPAAPSPAV
ncbi:MAG TPA: Asp-tRNA(Asn)/Glu-tRNA(Gln) amidotransferase subunit GatA, partial [Actinomycetota bacterium]|nr:Asp-tRNA(Asn)/Glu-tRNA(Gln) amidotransferase subunit GatA [Actinomycetota bacterium]